jgi:hypothetical protein
MNQKVRFQTVLRYALFAWFILDKGLPSYADVSQIAAPAKVLQARISHSDTMSRSELSSNVNNDQLSLASPLLPLSPQVAPYMPAQPLQANARKSIYNAQETANQGDMASDVRAQEYNVDWSGWLAKVADRWFMNLDQYERMNQTHYVTLRPALFRFTCYSNGRIADISMKQSSGNDVYDRLQMVALIQSMPVPPFPVGTQRQSITLVQGWESHVRQAGESDYKPGSFGWGFPMEKVTRWVKVK